MHIEQATARVKELTDKATSSREGLEQVAESIGGIKITSFSRASIMRGIAEKTLPKNWTWEIAEMVGGDCMLVVIGIYR